MARRSRAELAGRALGRALIEVINLLYQDNTAHNFTKGLLEVLNAEWERVRKYRKRPDVIEGFK